MVLGAFADQEGFAGGDLEQFWLREGLVLRVRLYAGGVKARSEGTLKTKNIYFLGNVTETVPL